ncbi:hypothetical protein P879_05722 [Paragonimus westermani]|uniref:Saposin B-type domain-containing protein n=1 Tax=Paragonimus westermani TaxID=34504 RepID=A0A8T0DX79_9TREM|nr:hypothetical protein P879_05722 [Paragonimus westermani]
MSLFNGILLAVFCLSKLKDISQSESAGVPTSVSEETCRARTESEPTPPVESAMCQFCEESFAAIKEYALIEGTNITIYQWIDLVCQPFLFVDECRNTLHGLFNSAIKAAEKIDPPTICRSLRLCSQQSHCMASDTQPTCEICRIVTQELARLLKDKGVEKVVNSMLKEMCPSLPDPQTQKQCTEFFNGTFEEWLLTLSSKIDSTGTCQFLELCEAKVAKRAFGFDISACDTCMDVVKKVKRVAESKKLVDDLRTLFDRVCKFAFVYEQKCRDALNHKLDVILKKLKETDPRTLCKVRILSVKYSFVSNSIVHLGASVAWNHIVFQKVEIFIHFLFHLV